MTEEQLEAEFGADGWKQLLDAVSKGYNFNPVRVEVEEHHIGIYAGRKEDCIVKEQEFSRYGLAVTRQNMANWCIRLGEEYISVLYAHLHKELYFYPVIQADETPVLVNRDGWKSGSKSYMWVYRSGHLYKDRQSGLYEY